MRLRLAIPVLCSVLLAAHFLRERSLVFVALSMLGIPLLFVRNHWVVRGMQLFFILASMEWIHTTVALVLERKAMGLPWLRMAIILGGVAALTLASAGIVNRRDLSRKGSDGRHVIE